MVSFVVILHILPFTCFTSNRGKPACSRCIRLSKECAYGRFKTSPPFTTSKSRSEKVQELEQKVADLQNLLHSGRKVGITSPPLTDNQLHHKQLDQDNTFLERPVFPVTQNVFVNVSAPQVQHSLQVLEQHPGFLSIQPQSLPNFSNTRNFVQNTSYSSLNQGRSTSFVTPQLSTQNANEWIFPEFIIESILTCFFRVCNVWPTKFIHEKTFIRSWKSQPKELVYAMCARGTEYNSQYKRTLTLEGYKIRE
ncbi:hypothetical protein HK096_010394, partial [Nowakowskiella sp. JEL0078]